jgi:hypothetical protein
LRIAHVFRAPLGGLFRHVIDLAIEQAARGHEVGVFFDSGGLCERVDEALTPSLRPSSPQCERANGRRLSTGYGATFPRKGGRDSPHPHVHLYLWNA